MVKRIISGGRTGAGQAALDFALKFDIPYGGWVPKGRKTENGAVPKKYLLQETDSASLTRCVDLNIAVSDGTIIISHGEISGVTSLTRKAAMEKKRPWLHIDLYRVNAFEAAKAVKSWVSRQGVGILHVAGPSAGRDPAIYQAVLKLLQAVFYLDMVESNLPDPRRADPFQPQTVKEAVEKLRAELPFRDKTRIARMDEVEIPSLQPTLGKFVRDRYGLGAGNEDLMRSCRYLSGKYELGEEAASALILKHLWETLRKTHLLRVVK